MMGSGADILYRLTHGGRHRDHHEHVARDPGNVIEVEHLTKRFGGFTAVDDITFEVRKGEIFGFLGANGAGKTTALECMEGLRAYDGGNITVHGRCGIQLQSAALPEHIRAAMKHLVVALADVTCANGVSLRPDTWRLNPGPLPPAASGI